MLHFTVDGISLTRSSNEYNDLFSGYTVNLLASTTVNGTDTPANLLDLLTQFQQLLIYNLL